ncbi:CCR4-associated factor (nucleomorph) [Cryptomonas paramecium]|uniref:poly(A)-specific ribonuclease n=1 Tax=Cryptomonas paramaecium TaxID=2898 RepID=F2HI18_9CRYP|nr:CCR4-associated factor [Cryptomonas paramecium]AEA38964.1 CCR4-associated factor [Cryptomonas paramecium]|mmetsp:Transcript_51907/g.135433  ORF Transcript_51907/g.135433 Transcript_51907/m.135433 type:complete len:272 (+) Transcript_51907:9540-10355(+)
MKIIQIWNDNVDKAMKIMIKLIEEYNYISMDTEFPGITSIPTEYETSEEHYQTLKHNVNILQIIQLGFSFANKNGDIPKSKACWQFNFNFNFEKDMFAQNSLDLLINSGVNFQKHKKKGIKMNKFIHFLIRCGFLFNKKIKWISFHSGYDFGYLIRMLLQKNLPDSKPVFFKLLYYYFPCYYDIKYLSVCFKKFYGGLDKIAEKLKVFRIGQQHQAGSDSLLTLKIFFKLKKMFFEKKNFFDNVYFLCNSDLLKQKKPDIFFESEIDDYCI